MSPGMSVDSSTQMSNKASDGARMGHKVSDGARVGHKVSDGARMGHKVSDGFTTEGMSAASSHGLIDERRWSHHMSGFGPTPRSDAQLSGRGGEAMPTLSEAE